MSKLIDFYKDEVEVQSLIVCTDNYWENAHDYIQTIFPLKTPSNFNPEAPILTDEEIVLFKNDPEIISNFYQLYTRFLKFLGLNFTADDEYEVCESSEFKNRKHIWNKANHNWLRITRLIAFLHLVSDEKIDPKSIGTLFYTEIKEGFFNCLVELKKQGYGSENSFQYWQNAYEGKIN